MEPITYIEVEKWNRTLFLADLKILQYPRLEILKQETPV
jgi:hypothetical protein